MKIPLIKEKGCFKLVEVEMNEMYQYVPADFAKCTATFSYFLKIQFGKLAPLHRKCIKIIEIKFNEMCL